MSVQARPTLVLSLTPPKSQEDTDEIPVGGEQVTKEFPVGPNVTRVEIFRGDPGVRLYEEEGDRARLLLSPLTVSRRKHAVIQWSDAVGAWVLEDQDSTNGTWVHQGSEQTEVEGSYMLGEGPHKIHTGYDLVVTVGPAEK